MTIERVGRQVTLGGQAGGAALRNLLRWMLRRLDIHRFACRAETLLDESRPQGQDYVLSVRMAGRIPAVGVETDTDLRLELLDITDSVPAPVLSVDAAWRSGDTPVFNHHRHNGVIPARNALLAAPVQVARIPLHLLRFARRGRRRIQATVTVLNRADRTPIVKAVDCAEYVFCLDGYLDLQERCEAVLRACVELACATAEDASPNIEQVVNRWIAEKTKAFRPITHPGEPMTRHIRGRDLDIEPAVECILSLGQKADRIAAVDLMLQIAAVSPTLSAYQEELLWTTAERLEIAPERFLRVCQHRLLTEACPFERWRLLLGVRENPSPDELRQRLNEQYRRWNARVTNADADIRRQADIILSLIAEVRSRQERVAGALSVNINT